MLVPKWTSLGNFERLHNMQAMTRGQIHLNLYSLWYVRMPKPIQSRKASSHASKLQVLNKASPQYQVIKAVCETKLNVPSQNLLIEKLKTARSQYWLNVALKVNVKLRGVNQTVADSSGALPGVYWNHYGQDLDHVLR